MVLMAGRKGVVAVPVSEQSEIFAKRRRMRRARINNVHAEVRAILQEDSPNANVRRSSRTRRTSQETINL